MDDLLKEFLAETIEALELLDSELVELEQRPADPALLGSIFRIMHTIKGTCGFLGLPRLEAVAHAAEDVLGKIRDGELAVTPEAVSLVLMALDRIKELIAALGTLGHEPEGEDEAIIADLRLMASGEYFPAEEEVCAEQEEIAVEEFSPEKVKGLYERVGGASLFDTACEQACTELLAAAAGRPGAENELLNLQFALAGAFASALGGKPGAAADLSGVLNGLVSSGWGERDLTMLRDELGRSLSTLEVSDDDIAAILSCFKAAEVKAAEPQAADAAETEAEAGEPAAARPARKAAPSAPKALPSPSEAAASAAAANQAAQSQTLRVNINVLENLMNMVSELVLTRNQLLQILRGMGDSPFTAPLQRLNQVTTELQESVMMTRMQPIGNAWGKLPRLVRDLTQELGKKIELVMSGADTELDRQILESIKDPLTHMVRNSADHGIETPEERRAAGKPETGSIHLSARHEGGHIIVQVADDGRGLPTARIRAKVVQNGLATEAQLDAMSEQQIQQFIFRAGFSTAASVTSVSGRGVGMDVVRNNIEKIGGVIEFSSTEGVGSRFVIKIPLTLAIVSALIVECAGERFAMPQSSVIELVRISKSSQQGVEMINGHPVYRLRDKLLPLVALNELLGLEPEDGSKPEPESNEIYVVVSQVGSFVFGIIVDRVFDTEEIVVKPVSRMLRHISLFSGTTILGDGRVIMILDPNGIAAATSGSIHGESKSDEDAHGHQNAGHETVSMLVFKAGGDGNKAVPLSLIARLEEADLSESEQAGERTVLQYRGGLMPLIGIDGEPARREGKHPILVFAEGERMLGLVVDEVVDIVEGSLDLQLVGGSQPGLLGSTIIAGRSTDLIDTVFYLRKSDAAWFQLQTHEPFGVEAERKVLLVEDSAFFRNLLMPMLKMAGYRVTIAEHGEAAIDICRGGEEFDIIISDIEMPGLNGFDLARTLRQDDRWKSVPMVALSSHASPQDFERGKNSGFTDYVTKLDPKALLTSLSRVLAADENRKEIAA
jgi:two-component system chemotaxis sensor kinase CheA